MSKEETITIEMPRHIVEDIANGVYHRLHMSRLCKEALKPPKPDADTFALALKESNKDMELYGSPAVEAMHAILLWAEDQANE